MDKLKEFLRYDYLVELFSTSSISRHLQTWNKANHVLASVLLASFIINLLSLAFPLFLLQVYDRIIPNNVISTLLLLMLGIMTAVLLDTALKIARSYTSMWSDAKLEHLLGCQTFEKLIRCKISDFEKKGTGFHLKRMQLLYQLRDFYSGQAIISIADIPFVILLLGLIIYIANWLVLVPIAMLLILISSTLLQTNNLDELIIQKQQHDDRRFNFIIETLNNIHTVKSLTMEALMMRRYERLQKNGLINNYDVIQHGADTMILGLSLSQVTLILTVSLGSIMIINGNLTIGGLAACTLLAGRCLQPINNLIRVLVRFKTIEIVQEDIKDVLHMVPESKKDLLKLSHIKGDIEFINIAFQYDNRPWCLKDFNLKINAKEAIAITGDTFSGKSSLLLLLLGFMQPNQGQIMIDNHNINELDISSLRKQIAYLPQEATLFQGTIIENLTMFAVDEYSDKAKKIADEVGIADLIEHLPDGYDTKLATQAIDALPRGFRQRIAITRALLHKPPIVLFDEANSAVDMHGDQAIKEMLAKLVGKCTLILISHRPSILNIATKQYEIKQGKLSQIK